MTKAMIEKALDRGGSLLGHMVWWALADARIDATTFKALWTGAGLDAKLLPDTGGPARALKEAGALTVRGHEHHLFRFAAETATHTIYAVVREDPDGVGTNRYVQEAQVAVDGAGTFTSDQPAHDIVQAVRAKFDEVWGSYQTRDVTAAMLRLLHECAAVTLRESGGVYFVPAPYAAQVASLRDVIGKLGGSSVTAIPLTADPEGQAAKGVGDAAKAGIEADLHKLREEMNAFAEMTSQATGAKDMPRASTLERRLERFEELRSKAALYRDVLSIEVSDLDAQIAGLEEIASTVLTVIEDAREGAVTGEGQAALALPQA